MLLSSEKLFIATLDNQIVNVWSLPIKWWMKYLIQPTSLSM